MSHEVFVLVGFLFLIAILLIVDLGIFNRKSHEINFKEALVWSIIWILFAFIPYFFILTNGDYLHNIDDYDNLKEKVIKYEHPIELTGNFEEDIKTYNHNLSFEYITGYLIEKSLSVDNIFVIIMILLSFGVNKAHYKKVLFWGIIGAIVLRFVFIFVSSALIQKFHWILYIFGIILVISGVKLFLERNNQDEKIDIKNHIVVRFSRKFLRITKSYYEDKFFIRRFKKIYFTPLFVVLLLIEFSDIVFAIDSVPAVFSVTRDPNIVFLSNICAIMGLRSLFFLLINALQRLKYLRVGLSALLIFVGTKMIFAEQFKTWGFKTTHSLIIILIILSLTIVFSLLFKNKKENP